MTEFKQIVGRGTRVHEDTKKFYFTLIDFRGATNHFADPDFDGEPVQIYEPSPTDSPVPPDDVPPSSDDDDPIPPEPGVGETIIDGFSIPPGSSGGFRESRKVYVDGVATTIVAERVEYLDENGKLITETLRDFTKATLKKRFASLDDFLKRWKAAERKQAVIDELAAEGLLLDPIWKQHRRTLTDHSDMIVPDGPSAYIAAPTQRRSIHMTNASDPNISRRRSGRRRTPRRARQVQQMTSFGDWLFAALDHRRDVGGASSTSMGGTPTRRCDLSLGARHSVARLRMLF
jgi:hypothetical protein